MYFENVVLILKACRVTQYFPWNKWKISWEISYNYILCERICELREIVIYSLWI